MMGVHMTADSTACRRESPRRRPKSKPMRRIPLILGLVLIFAAVGWDLYDFFITNEGVRYFCEEPRRLLYAVLFGVFVGLGAFGVSRLSPSSQRFLKLLALGLSGSFLLGVQGLIAFHLTPAASIVGETRMWGWIVGAFIAFSLVTVLVSIEFLHVWKRDQEEGGQSGRSGD